MTQWYHRKLDLEYDPSIFDDLIEFAETSDEWADGYDANGLQWNVRELDVFESGFPILEEIFQGLNFQFGRRSWFISSVEPGGLVNHIDQRKWANFGIPLVGDFESTPQYFHDQFNHRVESFILDKPTIFNTRMMHSVPRVKEATGPRWALMMDLYDWPDDLFRKVDQGKIWTDTKHFKFNG